MKPIQINRDHEIADYPLVTVIAACYNHERFAIECLEAIRAQTYPNVQLIITDDASTDKSLEVIKGWIDQHQVQCHLIAHEKNIGLTSTLNEALRVSAGKYISVIATDDLWLPEFLKSFVSIIEDLPQEYGVVYGNAYLIDETGAYLPTLRKRYEFHPEGNVLSDLIDETFLTSCAVLMKREAIESIGLYDENLCYEDFDLWTRLAEKYSFAYCPLILAKYRSLKTSMSQSRTLEMTASTIKIITRLEQQYPQKKRALDNRKVAMARDLYKLGYPRSFYYLFRYNLKNRSLNNIFLIFSAFFGFKYSKAAHFLDSIQRMRKTLQKIVE